MKIYNVVILGVSESRWTGSWVVTTHSNNTIIYFRRDDQYTEGDSINMTPTGRKAQWNGSLSMKVLFVLIECTQRKIITCLATPNETGDVHLLWTIAIRYEYYISEWRFANRLRFQCQSSKL